MGSISIFLPAALTRRSTCKATKLKVALALLGIGTPFRVSDHFMTRTTVIIIQDPKYEEWYQLYLEPFLNYIPVLGGNLEWMMWRRRWCGCEDSWEGSGENCRESIHLLPEVPGFWKAQRAHLQVHVSVVWVHSLSRDSAEVVEGGIILLVQIEEGSPAASSGSRNPGT